MPIKEIRVKGAVDITDSDLHIYANSSTGSDDNLGFDPSEPVQTLAKAVSRLPQWLAHNVTIHLEGTFTDDAVIKCHIDDGKTLVVDGGSNVTPDPTYGGPHAVTSSDVAWVEVSGAGWPVDAMKGMWLQDANDTTKLWLIFKNTADRIYPAKYFGTPPTSVNVVIPSTTITSHLEMRGCTGQGSVWLQRVSMTGSGYFFSWLSTSYTTVSHVYSTTSSGIDYLTGMVCSVSQYRKDPLTWATDTTNAIGVTAQQVWLDNISRFSSLHASAVNLLRVVNSNLGSLTKSVRYGTRITRVQLSGVKGNYDDDSTYPEQFESSSGYQPTEISGSDGNGITLLNSHLVIGADVYIQNNTIHGIEANNSQVVMTGSVKGSGNGGAGVYAHNGSGIIIKDGAPPTLTGTVGDVAVIDPESEDTTWADVDAGNPLQIAAESTTIREVA